MEYLPGDLPHKSPTMTSRTALVAVLVSGLRPALLSAKNLYAPHTHSHVLHEYYCVTTQVVVGVVAGAVVQQCRADAIDDEAICGGDSEAFKAAFQQVKFPDGIAASEYDGKVRRGGSGCVQLCKRLIMCDSCLHQVLLIVNVASKCGLTVSRYKDLNYLTSRFDAKVSSVPPHLVVYFNLCWYC